MAYIVIRLQYSDGEETSDLVLMINFLMNMVIWPAITILVAHHWMRKSIAR